MTIVDGFSFATATKKSQNLRKLFVTFMLL